MSLTIDYVSLPPKSQEASQLQVNEITRLEQNTQQLQTGFQDMVKQNQEKTIRREKAENEELKNEEEKKKRQKKKKHSSSQKGSGLSGENGEKKKEEKKKQESPHFDMRI